MYQDNTLLPREAIRLAALGILAGGSRSYAALAGEVRHFVSRIAGPSLDLMGTSIELLRHEGFIEATETGSPSDGATLAVTEAGREELRQLLCSAVRAPLNDINKLVLALKFRFLHLLDAAEQHSQAEMMIEACETELARLVDLRRSHRREGGFLADWLDHDIAQVEARLEWLQHFRARLAGAER